LKLALGTVQFGLPYGIANQYGQVSPLEAKAIIQLATANGIDTIDTANTYGDSEVRLGQIGVQGWQIVSKLPEIPDDVQPLSWIEDAIRATLHRLQIRSLYGVLLHRPMQLLGCRGEQIYQSLRQMRRSGLVEKIGVSLYDPADLDALCNHFQFDLVQVPFNILDRRLIDTGWLNRLTESGTEVHVRSIFLQGLLLMKSSDREEKFSRWSSHWYQWDGWLKDIGLSPLEACLRYALSFPQISKVIVGVDSARQLQQIIEASVGSLPDVPPDLSSIDVNLLNPANWAALT
jgi:aryl-alcohol dehydrogenase-like predicted oxidoreductase